jgi:hypothetical protein
MLGLSARASSLGLIDHWRGHDKASAGDNQIREVVMLNFNSKLWY